MSRNTIAIQFLQGQLGRTRDDNFGGEDQAGEARASLIAALNILAPTTVQTSLEYALEVLSERLDDSRDRAEARALESAIEQIAAAADLSAEDYMP